MDYYDDKRKSKFRSDRMEYNKSSKSSRYRDDDQDYEKDDYYSNKKFKSKQSRSRSRSRSRTRSTPNQFGKSGQQQRNKHEDSYSNGNNYPSVMPTVDTKRFNPGPPSRTIMLRQLPAQIDETEIRSEFNVLMVPFKDVRLVKNRDTGLNRGFAFVEFNSVEDAQNWMEQTQGWIMFTGYDNKVQLYYSHSNGDESFRSDRTGLNSASVSEWDCAKCGIRNFKRRERCFKCSISREESERRKGGEGYDYAGSTPCNTLLLRGLDALTSKEAIVDSLNNLTNFTLPIKNVHIARDNLTNVAMGFAFVEMNTIQDAGYLLQCYQTSFEIDGKQVTINYSKNSYKTAISQLETNSKISYQQLATANSDSYSVNQPNAPKRVNQADAANSAAAVAQAAMISMHKKQEILTQITSNLKQQSSTTPQPSTDVDSSIGANLKYIANQVEALSGKVYSAPDVTQFVYDETSGYYYDYSTGFYYDATSQYYYNSLTQQYMYWDPAQSSYIPVTNTTTTTTTTDTTSTTETKTTETPKQDDKPVQPDTADNKSQAKATKTPKTAAQIAKDMERWAESMNKKKDTKKTTTQAVSSIKATVPVQATPKPVAEFKSVSTEVQAPKQDDEQIKKLNERAREEEEIQKQQQEQEALKEQAKQEATSKAEPSKELDEANLIDTNKMACLLCKRKFDSIEILNKHVAKSDLHKTNLEKLRQEKNVPSDLETKSNEQSNIETKKQQSEADSLAAALKYRDRAMERRKKYGSPEPPSPPYSSSSHSSSLKVKTFKDYDDDSSSSLSNSYTEKAPVASSGSIAAKLMKKMGWSEGSGIGKNLQGISAPIEATMRQKGAGLGASGLEMDPNDTYQEAVKKSARARFERLNN